jgi:hypothetical protein
LDALLDVSLDTSSPLNLARVPLKLVSALRKPIGRVTGKGIIANVKDFAPRWEARDAQQPGSLRYKKFQRKIKEAEWELHRLGPSHGRLGFVIKIVDNEDASKE